jgi:hypothetical protein
VATVVAPAGNWQNDELESRPVLLVAVPLPNMIVVPVVDFEADLDGRAEAPAAAPLRATSPKATVAASPAAPKVQ